MNVEEMSEVLKNITDNVESGEVAKILQLSPESLSILYSLAYYLYENGKFVDAKSVFRFLTLSDTFDRRYWMGLAASYQMLKDYPAALECYSLAAIQNPNDPYVHLHAADCFFAGGDSLKAIKTLESAINAAKKNKDEALCSQLLLMHTSWITQPSK